MLTDLVRSYTTQAQSVVPQFLAMSFDMLRESQSKMLDNLSALQTPMKTMPGFEAIQRQQEAFLKTMMPGWPAPDQPTPPEGAAAAPEPSGKEDLEQIKAQLAVLEAHLAKLTR